MKILYFSVHAVLEDDETRMFKKLGHDVFPLGANFGFQSAQPFRDPIVFNETEHALLEQFRAMGCTFPYAADPTAQTHLTAEFIALFDVIVVMHDLNFIQQFWPVLSQRPVIWRTIGQNIDECEPVAAGLHEQGMHIVRYSPAERRSAAYCGETALIRFGKDPDDYGPWSGDNGHVLTFANLFEQRYPSSAAQYRAIVTDVPSMLGGSGNESFSEKIGFLSPLQQREHYNACRAYLYCSGPTIPYTLNFMEALMSGMPMVVTDFAPSHPFYEIPTLVSGGAGIVASTIEEAQKALRDLLDDDDAARQMSEQARARAIQLFSTDHIGKQWDALFNTVR